MDDQPPDPGSENPARPDYEPVTVHECGPAAYMLIRPRGEDAELRWGLALLLRSGEVVDTYGNRLSA